MFAKNKKPYDPDSLPPARRLRQNLGSLFSRKELSANRPAEDANDPKRVAPTQRRDLTSAAGDGACNAAKLGKKLRKRTSWMPDYVAGLKTWGPDRQRTVLEKVPMQLPHEVVAALLKHGFKEKLLETRRIDPLTLAHLQECEAEAGCQLLGSHWGDGAPTQWDRSESIDALSLSFPGTEEYKNLGIPLLACLTAGYAQRHGQILVSVVIHSSCYSNLACC